MSNKMIELGDEVQDIVTGTKGIAVCECNWIYGCRRWIVQPPQGKDGKVPDSSAFDEGALKITKKYKVKRPEPIIEKPPGGPVPVDPQNQLPKQLR